MKFNKSCALSTNKSKKQKLKRFEFVLCPPNFYEEEKVNVRDSSIIRGLTLITSVNPL